MITAMNLKVVTLKSAIPRTSSAKTPAASQADGFATLTMTAVTIQMK
jgi:hypothetical protein